jgi:pimeloyl-ACP methyl ester carboxylesterase
VSPLRRYAGALCCALLVTATSSASAATPGDVHVKLNWKDCADAPGFQCATASLPRDYGNPTGKTLSIAVTRLPARDQANRIGSLFVNYGGPGGDGVGTTQAIGADLFGALNDRFDIVSFDPRGVGDSRPSIDCHVNQEVAGVYSQPFATPENIDPAAFEAKVRAYANRCVDLNPGILPYVSTANVARDMDVLRDAVGDARLNYLGFSYGTFLGATYAAMFPESYRGLVLDGALDADQYINRPLDSLSEQTSGFERALGRFMQACAVNQAACSGFGGDDPWTALDIIVAQADQTPLPAVGGRPVTGDGVVAAAIQAVYAKQLWPLLAQALAMAAHGDGTGVRIIDDFFYGRLPNGRYDPITDRYFTLSADEQNYPSSPQTFLDAGAHSWGLFDHAWWNTGYVEMNWGLYPVKARDTFTGPFTVASDSPTVLVVGTTYDPATPYRGAKRLVRELGQARLLTMIGDGHTAYGGNSPCIDSTVDAYLVGHTVPAAGKACTQDVPFQQPQPGASARLLSSPHILLGQHVKPFVRPTR